MTSAAKTALTVQATINAPLEMVWKKWTTPDDIVQWNRASDDWHTPSAENDLRPGGRFTYRMEAREGGAGFDFAGSYEVVLPHQRLTYTLDDGRKVIILFKAVANQTMVIETFEAENTHPIEMQRNGWQAILDHFKKFVEDENNQLGSRS